MVARGNAQQTDKALNTIISAVIGLIIVISSYVLVNFVFQKAGGGVESVSACVERENWPFECEGVVICSAAGETA